jgi:hypothetical protein
MDLSVEQRLAIKFCLKAGKSATETLQMVDSAYGDQAFLAKGDCFEATIKKSSRHFSHCDTL